MSNTDTTTALVTRAVLRDFRSTPQKARRVVNLVRGQRADNALNMMKFANQPELGEFSPTRTFKGHSRADGKAVVVSE